MIWTPCGWLNKFYSVYMAVIVISLVDMAFELIHIIEANLVRVSQHCIAGYFHLKVVHK